MAARTALGGNSSLAKEESNYPQPSGQWEARLWRSSALIGQQLAPCRSRLAEPLRAAAGQGGCGPGGAAVRALADARPAALPSLMTPPPARPFARDPALLPQSATFFRVGLRAVLSLHPARASASAAVWSGRSRRTHPFPRGSLHGQCAERGAKRSASGAERPTARPGGAGSSAVTALRPLPGGRRLWTGLWRGSPPSPWGRRRRELHQLPEQTWPKAGSQLSVPNEGASLA